MATNKSPYNMVVDEVDAPVVKPRPNPKEKSLTELEIQQKTLVQIYSAQKRYPVRIAPSYAKHFGNTMRVTINGIAIVVYCNGQTYELPEEFAIEVERRMRAIDEMDVKSRKMGEFTRNYEPDIGRLNFF